MALINWEVLQDLDLPEVEQEGFLEVQRPWMLDGDALRPEYVDQSVPLDVLQPVYDALFATLSNVLPWLETERREWPEARTDRMYPLTCRRYQYAAGTAKLLYYEGSSTIMALEVPDQGLQLVVGADNGHPTIYTPDWSYANSDGSTKDVPVMGEPTPATILIKMAHDLWLHAHDREH